MAVKTQTFPQMPEYKIMFSWQMKSGLNHFLPSPFYLIIHKCFQTPFDANLPIPFHFITQNHLSTSSDVNLHPQLHIDQFIEFGLITLHTRSVPKVMRMI